MKLKTKLLLIIVPAFLVAFCIQVTVSYRAAKEQARQDMQREASNVRGVLMATRRVYHHQFLDSGIPLNSKTVGFLPAHSMNRISGDFQNWSNSGLTFNNVSDRPRNPDNAADDLELEAMAYYRANPLVSERLVPFATEDGEPYYHYSNPIWIEQYCLECHGKQEDAPLAIQTAYDSSYDYQLGDLRGIMSIKLPAGLAFERAAAAGWHSLWVDLAVYAGMFFLIYSLLVRYVARRLKKLGNCCRDLACGDYSRRSGITGSDEIGQAAAVFDRMAGRIEERDAALQASEERKHRIVETAHDAFISVDSSGFVTAWNAQSEQIFGWSREEILGQDLTQTIVPPQYREEHVRAMAKLAANEEAPAIDRRVQFTALRRNGQEFPIELAITHDRSGETVSFNAFARDITDRERAAEQLRTAKVIAESANVAKTEFLANMSHEIRTPMTAILGFAENLLDVEQSDSERMNCVHTIRRNGEFLLDLINDILDLSKIEAGKMVVEHRDCQPCHVIAEVASLMRVRADEKGLPLNIEYNGVIPETIQSDSTRLQQILINLIGNAIKFTESGAVRLVTRLTDGAVGEPGGRPSEPCLQFDVMDTGRGMSQNQVGKLFQPFMQADTSTTRKYGGTGLGLTISQRFAELLGGDITVAATEVGVGSTFRITVATGSLDGVKMLDDPLSATAVADTAQPAVQPSGSDFQGVRVLLAEDNTTNQVLVAGMLKKCGAAVTAVKDGKLALDRALGASDKGEPFDVILMDMQMPVMDGYEATGRLRQKGYTGPIIALTAHAMGSDREKCIQAGCDDYATKPIDRRGLILMIQRQLHRAEISACTS